MATNSDVLAIAGLAHATWHDPCQAKETRLVYDGRLDGIPEVLSESDFKLGDQTSSSFLL